MIVSSVFPTRFTSFKIEKGFLVGGMNINGIFWQLDELIHHIEKKGEFPSVHYPQLIESVAQEAHKGSGLVYELFSSRFNSAIENLTYSLPFGVKEQVLNLAVQFGYEPTITQENGDYLEDAADDEDSVHYCCHGIDLNCCPAGCGDLNVNDFQEQDIPSGFEEAGEIHTRLGNIIATLKDGKQLSPIHWCSLKHYIIQNPDACSWYGEFYVDKDIRSTNDLIKHFQAVVLEVKINCEMLRKIMI
ncbi:hypothetical protein [Vibrio cholerae]|uniref:hypothetical protein n=1 Tax=Vibrio cholerae TaxID=666 RepID=UPI001652B1DE|nr:hypothetical protein [Vibrio cholerae]